MSIFSRSQNILSILILDASSKRASLNAMWHGVTLENQTTGYLMKNAKQSFCVRHEL